VALAASLGWWMVTRPPDLEVMLAARVRSADGTRAPVALAEDVVLTENDEFWIDRLTLSRDAWVDVLLLNSANQLDVLAPASASAPAQPLEASTAYRIPGGGAQPEGWALDATPGTESVFVVASRKPVSRAELRALSAEVAELARTLDPSALTLRGVKPVGASDVPGSRTVLEQGVEEMLRERFDVVHRVSFTHR
jgi:hypothetical protein